MFLRENSKYKKMCECQKISWITHICHWRINLYEWFALWGIMRLWDILSWRWHSLSSSSVEHLLNRFHGHLYLFIFDVDCSSSFSRSVKTLKKSWQKVVRGGLEMNSYIFIIMNPIVFCGCLIIHAHAWAWCLTWVLGHVGVTPLPNIQWMRVL